MTTLSHFVRPGRGRAAAAAICAAALAGLAAPGAAASFKTAPPLKLPDLEGRQVEIGYGGSHVTLVNFWATWCLPCREEMPQIERLHRRYRERGFRAVGVALESGPAFEVKAFLKERKLDLSYTLLMGDDAVMEAYGDVQIVPTTYLVGPGGEVLKTFYGASPDFEAAVGAEIEKALRAAETRAPASGKAPAAGAAPGASKGEGGPGGGRRAEALTEADRRVLAALAADWSDPARFSSVDMAFAAAGVAPTKAARIRIGRHLMEHLEFHPALAERGPAAAVAGRDEKMILRALIDRKAAGEPLPTVEELAGLVGGSAHGVLESLELLEALGMVAPDPAGEGAGLGVPEALARSLTPFDLACTVVRRAGERPFAVVSLPEFLREEARATPPRRVAIDGLCAHCPSRVRIVLEGGAVAAPTAAVVLEGGGVYDALFLSAAHLEAWLREHPEHAGKPRAGVAALIAAPGRAEPPAAADPAVARGGISL